MKKRNNRILVIAAHPDDEVLGCGATIAKHAAAGDDVFVAILAEGIRSRAKNGSKVEARIAELNKCAEKANRILGVKKLVLKGFPDNEMDTVSQLEINREIEGLLKEFEPEIIYTHHASDVNVDHRRIFESVVVAARPQPGVGIERIMSFEVASSTEWQLASLRPFEPNWFVDVSLTWEKKLKALECYESEMRPWPHARSLAAIKAQLHWRGANVGLEAAEAFMMLRNIQY